MKKKLLAVMSALAIVMCFTACGETDTSQITKDEMDEFYSDPDSFTGRTIELTGQISDVEKDGTTVYLQMYHDIENYDENTVIIYENDKKTKFKDDEYIKVEGSVDGEFKGENILGGEVTAPQITADKVEKISVIDAFPASKTVEVDKTITKGKYSVTLEKVDWTDDETRVYLTVKNDGSSTFESYPDQGVIVQDSKQYEINDKYRYDSPSSEIKAGATSEGVVAFDKIDKSDFTYSFEGYDNDYNELEFKFDVTVKDE